MLYNGSYVFDLTRAKCCGSEIKKTGESGCFLKSCDLQESVQIWQQVVCELAGLCAYVLLHKKVI